MYEPGGDGFVAVKITVTACPLLIPLAEAGTEKLITEDATDMDQFAFDVAVTPINATVLYPVGIVIVPEHRMPLPVLTNVTVYGTSLLPASVEVGDMLAE